MTPFARGLGFGLGSALVISAAAGFWVGSETETRLIVAADDIPEGAVITVGMLDVRHVPVRFLSKRKLGVTNVAAVMGQQAIEQRAAPVARRRMHNQASRFGQHHQVFVLVADHQRHGFCGEGPTLVCGLQRNTDGLAGAQAL